MLKASWESTPVSGSAMGDTMIHVCDSASLRLTEVYFEGRNVSVDLLIYPVKLESIILKPIHHFEVNFIVHLTL